MLRLEHFMLGTLVMLSLAAGAAGAQEPCAGDCDGNGTVSINELIKGVNINLGPGAVGDCPAMDVNSNGAVTIAELIAAVDNSLRGCNRVGGATFAEVQAIFNASCTFLRCHGNGFIAGDLDLEDGQSFDQIVGVAPFNSSAREVGLLLVDPGAPANSFILVKVAGTPPAEFGSQMPLGGRVLSESEVRTIRDWIDSGALP